MRKDQSNIPQSVHQRLLNAAMKNGRPFQELLQHYAIERFLYRIGTSPHADQVLLKGALLLRVWGLPAARPTMDIDLLGKGGHNGKYWERFARECMSVKSVDDGMRYEPEGMTVEQITPDSDYGGWRIRFRAYLGRAWVVMQLDIGLGDAVAPAPIMIDYPTLIGMPQPVLKAYRPETAIAEKYQAMIELDVANSRMKDFFDIHELIRVLSFRGEDILAAIRKTFERRKTRVNEMPPRALTKVFYGYPDKAVLWQAFIKQSGVKDKTSLEEAVEKIARFLLLPTEAMIAGGAFHAVWAPGGPWRRTEAKRGPV